MEPIVLLQRTVDQAKRVVEGVRPDQLDRPTPCDDWDVRALLGHLVGGAVMFSVGADRGSVPEDVLATIMAPDLVGDDFPQRFAGAADDIVAAFSKPGVLGTTIELPFGTMPAPAVLTMATLDLAVHTADLAHATGQSFDDAELAEASIAVGRQTEAAMGEGFRGPRLFGAEQPAGDDAPAATRLLAFAGRKV